MHGCFLWRSITEPSSTATKGAASGKRALHFVRCDEQGAHSELVCRTQLFQQINSTPTLFEMVTGKARAAGVKRNREVRHIPCSPARVPPGLGTCPAPDVADISMILNLYLSRRQAPWSNQVAQVQTRTLLHQSDVNQTLKGKRAEVWFAMRHVSL